MLPATTEHPEPAGVEAGPVVVLFNRDLRVRDHPALAAACRTGRGVVPLFVVDPAIVGRPTASANRLAFLLDSLADLRQSIRQRGGELYVRRGEPVTEAMRVANQVGAAAVFATEDVSRFARARQGRLAAACAAERVRFATFPGVTVVEAGAVVPDGGDHYRVFTPYWNRWRTSRWRQIEAPPRTVQRPDGRLAAGDLPARAALSPNPISRGLPAGGETQGRHRARRWIPRQLSGSADGHDDLAGDRTSRLSPYLHFGCVSPLELARDAMDEDGGEALVRQLCWRDFHHQVLHAVPELSRRDYRPRRLAWREDPDGLAAWRQGRTGIPIVDAGMRQLEVEGWMHNRARLLAASFLTKQLSVHWSHGARHFADWLVDADVANNSGNWQWVAGTGNDTRPNRSFNLTRQARRHDPNGDYVRSYVPELADIEGPSVHQPWHLPSVVRRSLDYPAPLTW